MLLLIIVGYASCITADVACRITSVVKGVCRDVFLGMTYRTLEPVSFFVMIPSEFMCCCSLLVAASTLRPVGGFIVLLLKTMLGNIRFFATNAAFKPVIYIIMLVIITKIMLITFKGDKCAIIFFRICLCR